MDTLDRYSELERICSLFHEVTMLPVICVDADIQICCTFPSTIKPNPVYSSLQDQAADWIAGPSRTPGTVMFSTTGMGNYVLTTLHTEDGWNGWIIAGPALSVRWPEELVTELLHELHIASNQRAEWFEHYRLLPVINNRRLLHTAMLLHEWLTGQKLNTVDIIQKTSPLMTLKLQADNTDTQPAEVASVRLADNRESGIYHHTPDAEKIILKHIKSGNKKGLLQAFLSKPTQKLGLLSKRSPLRHQKNFAVSVITLATRTAIEGGMFPEEAYTLSDTHIQHIEELNELGKVENALLQALGDFADGVRNRMEQRVSRPISTCQYYIFDHLYEDLSLPVLAQAAGVSPTHLSRQFRKEVGVSLTEYIQRQQIEEAKHLLSLSGSSISDVAARLRFYDQSYFTKVFKKYTGVTPNQFRDRQAGWREL